MQTDNSIYVEYNTQYHKERISKICHQASFLICISFQDDFQSFVEEVKRGREGSIKEECWQTASLNHAIFLEEDEAPRR